MKIKSVFGALMAYIRGGGEVLRKWQILFVAVIDGVGHWVVYGNYGQGVAAMLIFCAVMSIVGGLSEVFTYSFDLDVTKKKNS